MAIPNKHLAIAQNLWNDANKGRNVLTFQRANGQLYRENDDSGKPLPAMSELQPFYDAWLKETAPERGFDHNGTSVPYTEADCVKVIELEQIARHNLYGNRKRTITFTNGESLTLTSAQFARFATAFHTRVASMFGVS